MFFTCNKNNDGKNNFIIVTKGQQSSASGAGRLSLFLHCKQTGSLISWSSVILQQAFLGLENWRGICVSECVCVCVYEAYGRSPEKGHLLRSHLASLSLPNPCCLPSHGILLLLSLNNLTNYCVPVKANGNDKLSILMQLMGAGEDQMWSDFPTDLWYNEKDFPRKRTMYGVIQK